ncbi:prolipoprotein diacylglyceryl transferase [Candidatus Woesearchaeota archaeon]|nr:prolipoprotein diacylglyceryl transferase [Candidatus Woesearchaeota archaeon]
MIANTIEPVLLDLGNFQVRYYGIIYALGFIICYLFLRSYIKKGKLKGLTENGLDDLMVYLLAGTVLGARLFNFVFYHPSVFWTDPVEIIRIWNGGLSFHGGLIGAALAAYIFAARRKINFLEIADAISVPAALALALGRIGNFTNHELYGPLTIVPWCVVFMTAEGCRHPYQIYASLSHLVLFGILAYVYKRQKKAGTTFLSFVTIYGAFRFMTDFFREEPRLMGISMGQFLSLIMLAAGLISIIKRRKN